MYKMPVCRSEKKTTTWFIRKPIQLMDCMQPSVAQRDFRFDGAWQPVQSENYREQRATKLAST